MAGRRLSARAAGLLALIALLAGCGEPEADKIEANAVAQQLGAVEVRPGLWQVDTSIESASQPGLPVAMADRMKGPRPVVRHCITPEQAARPNASFLARRQAGTCTDRSFEMRGGRIAGAMTCRSPDGAASEVRMAGSYSPERYDLRLEMQTPGIGPGTTITIVSRQTGRRVGECAASEETKQ
jgi:uncharacterized protein DUF3617